MRLARRAKSKCDSSVDPSRLASVVVVTSTTRDIVAMIEVV
jgi:hypothetical protein